MNVDVDKGVQTILYGVLNWGLGHATRSIPLIQMLISQGKTVIIASDGEALLLLGEAFPDLVTVELPSYSVTYKGQHLWQLVLYNLPNVATAIIRERRALAQLVRQHSIDMVISDSRFGLSSTLVKSAIISHQLHLLADNRAIGYIMNRANRYFLNSFDECWIPDSTDPSYSGLLSQNPRINNQRRIGVLSRLIATTEVIEPLYDLGFFLSGPEPARTELERHIIDTFSQDPRKILLVRGTNLAPSLSRQPISWVVRDRINSKEINTLLLACAQVVSRSGYSSIMDYIQLGIGASLIPTPGQSEQEYLAKYLDGSYGFRWIRQLSEL